MTTLIRNATVVCVDAQRQIFSLGAVSIDGSRMTGIGPSDEVEQRNVRAERVVEGDSKMVLPGFVSAHDHLGLRGCVGVMVIDVDVDKRVAGETVFSEQKCAQQLSQAIGFAEN
jgi:5-methylthioadenosine/S-adenosylhomocysteine deaminase